MPDFFSNIELAPKNDIGAAIGGLTNTLMGVETIKRQEDERKMKQLTDLATIAIGDVTAEDNLELQKQKDSFLKTATTYYREHNGRLPFEKQAELNSSKQQILTAAAKAEQDKKDYYDVVKTMATNDKVDKDETQARLKQWMKTPLGSRPSPYSAVRLNFDLNEYFKKNIVVNPDKSSELVGSKLYTKDIYEKEDVLTQMVAMYKDNPAVRQKIDDQMAEAGITPKTYDDVKSFMEKEEMYKPYTRNDVTFSKWNTGSNTTVVVGPGTTNPDAAPSNKLRVRSIVDVDGVKVPNNGAIDLSLEAGDLTALPNKSVKMMQDANKMSLSNHGSEITNVSTSSTDFTPAGIQPLRSYYNEKANRWFIATDEWIEKHPDAKTEMKPWVVGSEKVGIYDKKTKQTTYSNDEIAYPATKKNLDQVRRQLGKKVTISSDFEWKDTKGTAQKSSQVTPITPSTVSKEKWAGTVSGLKARGWSDADIEAWRVQAKIKVQ